MTKPRAIILEIDGCLADDSHRRHFILPTLDEIKGMTIKPNADGTYRRTRCGPDWESYYALMGDDKPNEAIHEILVNLPHYYLLFVTGRPEKCWQETIYWLDGNDLPTDEKFMKLFMRPDFLPFECPCYPPTPCTNEPKPDYRSSHIVKREIFEREIRDKYQVIFVLENNLEDAEMYRDLGLAVLKVMS